MVEKLTKSLNLVHLSPIAFSFKSFTSLRVVCNLFRSLLGDGDHELYCKSTIEMCLMETRFVCVVGLLLCCGSSSSFFLSSGFPFFFSFLGFLFLGFVLLSSFSGFVHFFCCVFEIECKKLEIHVFLDSTVKNLRSMWYKRVQLSKLSK